MFRVLFIILSLGFFIQCTGATGYLNSSVSEIEQWQDDNKGNEESGKAELKKDQDQFAGYLSLELNQIRISDTHAEYMSLYPTGFHSKLFMPPRC